MSPAKASVRDALQRYKAGIPTEDLLAIGAEEIAGPSIELTGLHLHLGRHSADPEMWRAAVDDLANLIAALRERWNGWSPRELDLGGGYPAPRDPFGRLLEQRSDAPDRSPPAAALRGGDLPARSSGGWPIRGSTRRASGSSWSRVGRSTPTPGSTWRRSATSSARRSRPR